MWCTLKFAALKYLPTSSLRLEPSTSHKAVRRHTTQRGGSLTTHHTSGKKFGSLDHCAILWINENEKLRNIMWRLFSTWRSNSEITQPQNRTMYHEISKWFSVSSAMSSYSASLILLVLPSAPFCYTRVGQVTFSRELRWGQNKLIATQCNEWDKRVLTKDTNRNNLKHESKEWKKYRSYLLITNVGERMNSLEDSNLWPSDFTIWKFDLRALQLSLRSQDIRTVYIRTLPRSET